MGQHLVVAFNEGVTRCITPEMLAFGEESDAC